MKRRAAILRVKISLWLTVLLVGAVAAWIGAFIVTAVCLMLLSTPLLSREFRLLVVYRGPGTIYALDVEHPTREPSLFHRLLGKSVDTSENGNRIVIGYVGKTVRPWEVRIREHLKGSNLEGRWTPPKPWADTVVEYYQIFHSEHVTGLGLAFREIWYIRRMKPIYNVIYNTGNPRRIKPALAKAQAEMRGSSRKLRVPLPRVPREASFGPVHPARGRVGRTQRANRFARVEGRIRFDSNGRVVRSGSFYQKTGR